MSERHAHSRAATRSALPSSSVDRDVDEEITFHLDSRVRELTAQGQPEHEARRQAEAEFGDLPARAESSPPSIVTATRRERVEPTARGLVQDVRYAVRSLRRSPAFSSPRC